MRDRESPSVGHRVSAKALKKERAQLAPRPKVLLAAILLRKGAPCIIP